MDFFAGQFFMRFLAGLLLHALSQRFYRGFLPGDVFRELFRMDDFQKLCVRGFLRALFRSAFLRALSHDGLFRSFFLVGFSVRCFAGIFFRVFFAGLNSVRFFAGDFLVRSLIGAF